MPEISIIVPVYKTEKYIHRCVDSILAQTFTDFELILVDDGSPDNCGAICDEYAATDERVHVIHQENQGQAVARNHALDWVFENSTSEWISFIDSDDWVHVKYLACLLEAAQKNNTLISSCNICKTDRFHGVYDAELSSTARKIPASDDYMHFSDGVFAYPFMRLFAKKLWVSIRFPNGKLWEDLATIYKVLFSCDWVAWVPECLYFYFINSSGTVCQPWKPKRMDEFDAYEEQLAFFSSRPENQKIYETLQRTYIRAISYSYFMEQESDLPPKEKKYYAAILQRKMRLALRKYGKTAGITFRENTAVFDTAYPGLMQLYWIVQSRINRLKGG